MASSPTNSFWDSLAASGVKLVGAVVKPLGSGLSQGLENLVQAGQNKVGQLAQTIVKTTDPNNLTSQPAAPPTTSIKPAPTAQTEAAAAQLRTTLLVLAGLAALFFFMRNK